MIKWDKLVNGSILVEHITREDEAHKWDRNLNLIKILAFFCSGFADEKDSMLRQRGQLQPQFRRQVVEVGRLVGRLLSVPQDKVEDSGRVEMSRVESRTGALRQNKLVRQNEVVDSSGNPAGHH